MEIKQNNQLPLTLDEHYFDRISTICQYQSEGKPEWSVNFLSAKKVPHFAREHKQMLIIVIIIRTRLTTRGYDTGLRNGVSALRKGGCPNGAELPGRDGCAFMGPYETDYRKGAGRGATGPPHPP